MTLCANDNCRINNKCYRYTKTLEDNENYAIYEPFLNGWNLECDKFIGDYEYIKGSVTLVKVSKPGFSKNFSTRRKAAKYLRSLVCPNCKILENLDHLLKSHCGAEYWIETTE